MLQLIALAMMSTSIVAKAWDFHLHGLFNDHMVQKRDTPFPVYGERQPGARMTVKIGGSAAEAQIVTDGKWVVQLPAMPHSELHTLEAAAEDGAVRIDDLLVGDVWIVSGQLNMEWRISSGIGDAEKELADANVPQIRFFNVSKRQSDVTKTEVRGAGWQVASPHSIRDC
ncbi:MAG: hypothetical protein RLZZ505_2711 [Verrucomicrobiota bacterium]